MIFHPLFSINIRHFDGSYTHLFLQFLQSWKKAFMIRDRPEDKKRTVNSPIRIELPKKEENPECF